MVASYGFELECFGLEASEISEGLNEVGSRLHGETIYGYHRGPGGNYAPTELRDLVLDSREHGFMWKAEEDGSLSGPNDAWVKGHEVISPILWGQEGLDNMARTARALRRAGADVNPSCGVHVTIGIEGSFSRFRRFGRAAKARCIGLIVEAYDYFQNGFDALVSESRREGSPGAAYINNRYSAGADRYCPRVEFGWGSDGANQFGQGSDTHYSHIVNYGVGRGVVNVSSDMSRIEFRQHNGTLNGANLKNWALLLHQLVSAAINRTAGDMRAHEPTLHGLMAWLNVGSDLRTALETRAASLRERSTWVRDNSDMWDAHAAFIDAEAIIMEVA